MHNHAMPNPTRNIPQRGSKFSRWFGRRMLASRGWTVSGQFPDVPKAVLLGAPHTSNWDGFFALALTLALGLRVQFVTKASLFRWPVAGLLRWLGFIPIDREKASNIVTESIAAFGEREQLWLVMAPEGTRNNAEKIKTGFYRIASGAGVPVLPCTMDFKRKVIIIGDMMVPSGDMQADLAPLMDLWTSHPQCRPERLSTPMKNWKAGKGSPLPKE